MPATTDPFSGLSEAFRAFSVTTAEAEAALKAFTYQFRETERALRDRDVESEPPAVRGHEPTAVYLDETHDPGPLFNGADFDPDTKPSRPHVRRRRFEEDD